MKSFTIQFLLITLLITPAFAKKAQKKTDPNRLTIMTYNVENLFDTKDDPNKEDETYLPLKVKKNDRRILEACDKAYKPHWRAWCKNTDWTEKALKQKMHRLSDVIHKANNKKGPDVLIMQEVENLEVLEQLRKNYLADIFPNPAILLEGPDERGIDVGILSRLPQKGEAKLHELNFVAEEGLPQDRISATRGILEAQFELPDGSDLYVFGVHFPSQGTPTPARKQALAKLTSLMKAKPKTAYAVAGGDFNIARLEEAKNGLYQSLKDDFLVSHLVGCQKCIGTNYYHTKRSWSFLDALVFTPNFGGHSKWTMDPSSVRVFNKSLYQVNRWGSPSRFNGGKKKDGVSDHWPVLVDIYKAPEMKIADKKMKSKKEPEHTKN